MVLVVVVGDIHMKKNNSTISDLVIHKITEHITKTQPDFVVLLGDVLDNHEKIDMKTQNRAIRFIRHIASICPIIVIIGNHDRPNSSTFLTEDSCFYGLKNQPNIHIADRVLSFKFETNGMKDKRMRFIFVPYVTPGSFHEALDMLDDKVMDDRPVAIFCHQEFKGAKYGGRVSKRGDEWSKSNPLVISGHIHVFQQPQPNIVYPGTPYQTSYSDDSPKGILIAEFLIGKPPNINFLELEIRKKKIIKLKPHEVSNFVPPPNCDVKVMIEGDLKDIKSIQSTGILKKMIGKGIHVSLDPKTTPNPKNPDNKSFKDLLSDMIKEDKGAIDMYNSIFSQEAPKQIGVEMNLTQLLDSAKNVNPTNISKDPNQLLQNLLKGTVIRAQSASNIVLQSKPQTKDIQDLLNQFSLSTNNDNSANKLGQLLSQSSGNALSQTGKESPQSNKPTVTVESPGSEPKTLEATKASIVIEKEKSPPDLIKTLTASANKEKKESSPSLLDALLRNPNK